MGGIAGANIAALINTVMGVHPLSSVGNFSNGIGALLGITYMSDKYSSRNAQEIIKKNKRKEITR